MFIDKAKYLIYELIYKTKFTNESPDTNKIIAVQAICFPLVKRARLKLTQDCLKFNCKLTWEKLSESEKSNSPWVNRENPIYYGTILFTRFTKSYLNESKEFHELDISKPFLQAGNNILFLKLTKLGIPQKDAKNWLFDDINSIKVSILKQFSTYSHYIQYIIGCNPWLTCFSPNDLKQSEILIAGNILARDAIRCHICNHYVLCKTLLPYHIKEHKRHKMFTCHICQHRFHKLVQFHKHMKNHITSKLFKCDICSLEFSGIGSYICHRRTHVRLKDKKFIYFHNKYNETIKFESNYKQCIICFKKSSRNSINYIEHWQKTHNNTNHNQLHINLANNKQFSQEYLCSTCFKQFWYTS